MLHTRILKEISCNMIFLSKYNPKRVYSQVTYYFCHLSLSLIKMDVGVTGIE